MIAFLSFQASILEEYGIKVEKIDESYTSQAYSIRGRIHKSNRKYRRLYVYNECGKVINPIPFKRLGEGQKLKSHSIFN